VITSINAGDGASGRWSGGTASCTDIHVAVVLIAQTPDNRAPVPVVCPSILPVLCTSSVPTPRHARPELVINTTQVHLYTHTLQPSSPCPSLYSIAMASELIESIFICIKTMCQHIRKTQTGERRDTKRSLAGHTLQQP